MSCLVDSQSRDKSFHKNAWGREKWEDNINTEKHFIPGFPCNRQHSLGESISSFIHDPLPNKTSQKEASSREEAAGIQPIG